MSNRSFTSLFAVPAFVLGMAFVPAHLRGQATTSIPRTVDGKPDVSGVWTSPGFKHSGDSKHTDLPTVGLTRFKDTDLPFRPGGEKLWVNPMIGDVFHDDPTLLCFRHPEWEVLEQFCEENNKDVGLIDFLKNK